MDNKQGHFTGPRSGVLLKWDSGLAHLAVPYAVSEFWKRRLQWKSENHRRELQAWLEECLPGMPEAVGSIPSNEQEWEGRG